MKVKSWFTIEAKANGTAEIAIYDEIGMFGISAKQFNEQLRALGDVQKINLRINSPGGDVFDGVAIFNMLKRHKATVHVTVDGLAASIASVIAMAGDKISMPDNAMMMIHNPWGGVLGDADDMRDMAEALDKIKISITSAYRRSGKTDDEISAMMDAETWLTAADAVAAGFADEVVETMQIAAFFDLSKFQNPPAALAKRPPEPSTEPAPTPLSSKEGNAIVAKAAKILEEQENATRRRSLLVEAAAIVQACADGGHADLAADFLARGLSLDEVKAELAKPGNLATATLTGRPDEIKKIYMLCEKAGVSDLAERFITEGRTVAWVENRLQNAQQIRVRCSAAQLPHRADGYIRAGLTLDEVSANLLEIKFALQAPEIDNHIAPEGERQGNSAQRQRTTPISEVYARRNARPTSSTQFAEKLARLIAEHAGR